MVEFFIMIPLTNCPYCNSFLEESAPKKQVKDEENNNYWIPVANWFEKRCSQNCNMFYRQFYKKSLKDDKLSYIQFNTSEFYVYVYFEYGFYSNITHIYLKSYLEEHVVSRPTLKLDSEYIYKLFFEKLPDINKSKIWLDSINVKFKALIPFA